MSMYLFPRTTKENSLLHTFINKMEESASFYKLTLSCQIQYNSEYLAIFTSA